MENEEMFKKSILLIGPSGAGKSTVAEELCKITGLPRLCLDRIANEDRKNGIMDKFQNADQYNSWMIKRLMEEAEKVGHPTIVDFGAGHSVYDDLKIFNEIKSIIKQFKNVVFLIPSVDIEKSLKILKERSTGDTRDNRKFLTNSCNRELATITIYENDKKPIEIAEEILRIIEEREMKKEENDIVK